MLNKGAFSVFFQDWSENVQPFCEVPESHMLVHGVPGIYVHGEFEERFRKSSDGHCLPWI